MIFGPAWNPALPLLALLTAAGPMLAGRFRRGGRGRGAGGEGEAGEEAPGERGRWRELGIPWALLGLAGMALLAPALALPDGIPSPAATLAGLPPWAGWGTARDAGPVAAAAGSGGALGGAQGAAAPRTRMEETATGASARSGAAAGARTGGEASGSGGGASAVAAAGNPLLRDVTFQIQPWMIFLRRELRAGRLPGWNPYQFAGAPFWGNGQSAVLFPLHLLFAMLPLVLGFCVLPWLRLVIGGCGVWMMARELGLGLPGAALAAVSFALSGMLVSFLLFPMGNALALVPWVLWAVERVAATAGESGGTRARAAAGLAVATGLQLLAGHPETAAHTALITLIYLAVRGGVRAGETRAGEVRAGTAWRAWLGWCGGWFGGAALAAAQLVPLAATLPATTRWQAAGGGAEPPLVLLLAQPLRLVLPELYGHPARGTWWGPFNYSATAVYAGALVLPLAAAGLARCRRDRRWLALAVVVAFAFAAAYHWPGLRTVLGALPVLGRAAHHRLLFAVELGAALLAGAGLDEWLAGRGRGMAAGAAAAAALLGAAWLLHRGSWAAHGLTGVEAAWSAGVAAVAAACVLSLRLRTDWRFRLTPLVLVLAVGDLLVAHGAINPALALDRLYPATGAVRFLAGKPGRVAGLGDALRPDTATVYGLYDLRGDDPVKLARFEAAYGRVATPDTVYYQPIREWESPWLDDLGVRWVVAGPDAPAAAGGWRLAYAGADARVYERPIARPLVRWADRVGDAGGAGPEELRTIERLPGRWEIAFRSREARRLVVAETWDPGWSASVSDEDAGTGAVRRPGRDATVEVVDGVLMGARVGPGAGRLVLRYRPPGLVAGAGVSGLALLLIAGALVWSAPAPRPTAPGGAGEGTGAGPKSGMDAGAGR